MRRSKYQNNMLRFNVLVNGQIFAAFAKLVDAEDCAYGMRAEDESHLIEIEENSNLSGNKDAILKLKPAA